MKSKPYQLLDANIDVLSKTIETSKRSGKTLKAEFIRDDGMGGKYYGYMRGGQVHVIHSSQLRKKRGKWGGSSPYRQQLGVSEDMPTATTAPESAPDQSIGLGEDKTTRWKQDANQIIGGAAAQENPQDQGGIQEEEGRPQQERQPSSGGTYVPPTAYPGGVSKSQTNLQK